MIQTSAVIIANTKIAETLYKLDLALAEPVKPRAGQFLTIRISDTFTPLLRRPFAFSDFDEVSNTASIIYQVKGQGTELLRKYGPKTLLDIIAPLGKPFLYPQSTALPVLVAGGIGLGPILYLASSLQNQNIGFKLVFGCKNSRQLPSAVLSPFSPAICTDDGSTGFHGTVVDYLQTRNLSQKSTIYCCGPHPMLHACHQLAAERAAVCYVSVEQTMACGVGACMGCVVKVNGPTRYVRACKEGPVFNSKDIAWE